MTPDSMREYLVAHAPELEVVELPEAHTTEYILALVCRVMMGFAALVVLGMTATLASAQTVEVKEKPPLYRYVSYWTFPRAQWGDVDKDNATSNQKLLAPSLADGTLVGYGDDENQVHSAEGFTYDNWWQAKSLAGLMKVLVAFHHGGGGSSPLLVSSTKHWDQIYISNFYNWKSGTWKDHMAVHISL